MQFAIELYPIFMTSKYGGAGDRSELKIWWCRGQVGFGARKYGGAGDRSAENMVVQGTGQPKGAERWWCRGQVKAEIWWCRGQVKIERPVFAMVCGIFCCLVFSLLIRRLNLKRLVVITVPY
jgi:hypothetical protein